MQLSNRPFSLACRVLWVPSFSIYPEPTGTREVQTTQRGFPFHSTAPSSTPGSVCLPNPQPTSPLPQLLNQIPPGSLACIPLQSPTEPSPRAPAFRLPLLPPVHLPRLCSFQAYPPPPAMLPLHTDLPPQLQPFSGFSLCPSLPVHEPSPQILRFPGSPLVSRYTNWPPWVRQFPEPLCSLARQLHLPRFSCFQDPLICPVHGYLSQVLLFPGHPPLPQFPCTRIRFQLMLIAAA